MNTQQIWQAVLGELELSLSKANFTTWFKDTFILEIDERSASVGVPTAFAKNWLESKYSSNILKTLRNITERDLREIKFLVSSLKNNFEPKELSASQPAKTAPAMSVDSISAAPAANPLANSFGLNTKYVFDNFVIGKNNELAHAASLAVAANPGLTYNPLFIYGGSGLGKTHLLQAIGHEILKREEKKKILYITCEKFTNDYVNSMATGKAASFKDVYRSVDLLLIDDIQFIAGKERTQEEFFHTFNALHQNNRQVVISCDRPPKSIPALESRLLTRFEWGMIADISSPDLETRLAILEAKIREKNFNLNPEVIHYLASNISNNIRELEGALNRILAYHQLNALPPTLESVKRIIANLTTNIQKKSITTKEVIQTVASFYDVSLGDLLGKCREKKLVTPRQIIMFLLRSETNASYPTIGQELGGRDHTTAIHAVNKVQEDYDNNEKIRREIEQIKQRLYV